jgi:hypothetical protein
VRYPVRSPAALCRFTNMRLAFYYTFKFILVLWMSLPQTG